ncbi:glutamate-1-semialdehyde 2,1-aminomutase [Roseomonas rosea]|uniref:Glutamate-1-semialdehyde 2,1-aminomutase n=1 Tax=Muricoccus roseus TaxID=198092 RepID=A0A1M6H7P9_9PROT|nr:aminotransferase class III-fold pyridoxal phosphate-dependent enzyme [Roseomonas rosea]SHJ18196.1 glutamate-1-semialdehyde 2,1-aminomutase [Roseomonas rosea]
MSATALRRNLTPTDAVAEARARYAAARPESAAIHAQARGRLAGGNTRSVLFYAPFPTAMERGEGCWLLDVDGNRYLDLCGEYTAGLLGHTDARVAAAVARAMDGGISLAGVGRAEGAFAALMCERFPVLERVRFTNSGTEANLLALAAARAFTGRTAVMAFEGGYHGGVLSYTAGQNPVNMPVPTLLVPYNDIEAARTMLRKRGGEIAAVIVEPMLGSGGCIPAAPGFLAMLREETAACGALLICDEVMTSRHGPSGAAALAGVRPDLATFGKWIAGGLTAGAFGGREAVMAVFDGHRPGSLPHAGTFNNNVLSMAAGPVALAEAFPPARAETLFAFGESLRARLNAVFREAGVPACFTGMGSMMTVHFRDPPPDRPYAEGPEEAALRELFFFDMLEAGIYLARRGMVALSLPVGPAEADRFVEAVTGFVAERGPLLRGAA